MKPYKPKFLGKNWKVVFDNGNDNWKGAVLHKEPEQLTTGLNGEIVAERLKARGLNAKALEYLLGHQDKIPKEWEGKCVYFFGTIIRDPDGRRHVLCLYRGVGRWNWSAHWLECGWCAGDVSAVSQVTPQFSDTASLESLSARIEKLEKWRERVSDHYYENQNHQRAEF